jgi:hypothetical protein
VTSPLDRAKQLLALAADRAAVDMESEEGRTSAMLAAKIIKDHEFEIVEKGRAHAYGRPPAAGPQSGAWPGYDPFYRDPPAQPQPAREAPHEPSGPPPGYRPGRQTRHRNMGSKRGLIPAMYSAKCPYCSRVWKKGELVAWARGLKMTCAACRERTP